MEHWNRRHSIHGKCAYSFLSGLAVFAFVIAISANQIAGACEGSTIFACKNADDAQSIFDNVVNPEIQEKKRQTLIKTGMCKNICRENIRMSGSKGLFVIYEDGEKNKWFVR